MGGLMKRYRVRIEHMGQNAWWSYSINADSSKLAYQWGQKQREHSMGEFGGMIEVKALS